MAVAANVPGKREGMFGFRDNHNYFVVVDRPRTTTVVSHCVHGTGELFGLAVYIWLTNRYFCSDSFRAIAFRSNSERVCLYADVGAEENRIGRRKTFGRQLFSGRSEPVYTVIIYFVSKSTNKHTLQMTRELVLIYLLLFIQGLTANFVSTSSATPQANNNFKGRHVYKSEHKSMNRYTYNVIIVWGAENG